MSYICSYCKTGPMTTEDQYLNHIGGIKHKKKVFQLQAPNDGIEYKQFIKQKTSSSSNPYVENYGDFPSLSNISNSNENNLEYSHIKNKYISNDKPIVVYEDSPKHHDKVDENDEVSIDDIFIKKDSKIESALHIANSYLKKQKTAAQALNEIAKAMCWFLDFVPVHAINGRYALAVLIDNIEFTIGEGDNKKEAKQNASAEAIIETKKKIRRYERGYNSDNKREKHENHENRPHTSLESIADSYEKITLDKINQIERCCKISSEIRKRYAAFIVTERFDQKAKHGTVVAFGAGEGVLEQLDKEEEYPGYCMKIFDALVLAKRSLQCFFYNQICQLFADIEDRVDEKLYLEIASNGLVRFKRGCRLHLFLSHAPEGDCVTSIPYKWKDAVRLSTKEVERDRNGIMEPIMYMSYSHNVPLNKPGHIRVLKTPQRAEWTSLVNYRVANKYNQNLTISASDKLMMWIHLGIQGAMLSHLMNPIYLYSVQFGKDYMHEHISRALLCRVSLEYITKNRGPYYDSVKYFDPYFERVSEIQDDESEYSSEEDLRQPTKCVNWYLTPVTDLPEIINTITGCVHRKSPFQLPDGEEYNKCSRLSKVCMLMRFMKTVNCAIDYFSTRPEFEKRKLILKQVRITQENFNRHTVKYFASDYRALKKCLFESLHRHNYGEWLPDLDKESIDLTNYYEF